MNYIIFLGIDPGLNIIGLSIIKYYYKKKKIILIKLKEIKLKKKINYKKKLFIIYNLIKKNIKKYNPKKIIMENIFLGKNIISLKRLMQFHSFILFLAFKQKIKIIKYYPKTIKLILTGSGKSNKKNIKNKIESLFKKKINKLKNYDSIDSLANIITHIFYNKYLK
ncbi:MAG: crossover junction endodeoxyribonuclease RuvC [Candidatus Shikimatogenerans bostrichidophilus]|nr:MAG: crossover junction endodeoxyribonuclease RuvC [Candidatus Shikimatogenerans bostrichidophilus]